MNQAPPPVTVTIPLVNPNEPEALIASLEISEGQHVEAGDLLCTLETTKATADVFAEAAGYVSGLHFAEGDTVRAGEILCYLGSQRVSESASQRIGESASQRISESASQRVSGSAGRQSSEEASPNSQPVIPDGLRITTPALELARTHSLDLARLPLGPLVTEKTVRALLEKTAAPDAAVPETDFDPAAIVIFGAGGHGKACLDLLRALGRYRVVGFVDEGRPAGEQVMGLPVLGGADVLGGLHAQGVRLAVNAVGGISSLSVRVRVFRLLAEAGFAFPAIVHPSAVVEPSAALAPGVQVFPQAYVGSEAQVGFGSIVNTGAIVSHDCQLGAFTNLSPGATLAGEVVCGERVLVGMGATVNLQVKIGAGARIGNGATVKRDVPANGIVRAGGIWPA